MADLSGALAQALRHRQNGEYFLAEGIYRHILRQHAQHAEALDGLGVALFQAGRTSEGIELLQQAVSQQPHHALCRYHLGSALAVANRLDEAQQQLQRALELQPDLTDALVNLAGVLQRAGRFEEALPLAEEGVRRAPGSAKAHYNLGSVLSQLGRGQEALEAYTRAVQLKPGDPAAQFNLALARLSLGEFAAGWDGYGWREAGGGVVLRKFAEPLWQGESLAGQTILVHGEQGLGDEILFASCLSDLIDRAGHVVIACRDRLQRLFARSFPQATVEAADDGEQTWRPETAFDVHVPAGTVPRYVRRNWDSFPQRDGYLTPDEREVARWRRRLAELGPGLKVGISWEAGGQAHEQLRRTTKLSDWAPVLQVPGVQFVNLQYGDHEADLAEVRRSWGAPIHSFDEAEPLGDLDAVAAQVKALDLVISVGNTTAHLAGALGVEAWVLVPAVPGWRWLLAGDRIPWYTTVEVLRQPKRDDWHCLFDRVARRLADRSAGVVQGESNSPLARSSAARVPAPAGASAKERFEQAFALHQQGEREAAESAYREVLQRQPGFVEALHGLGVLLSQAGRSDEALPLLKRAIDESPSQASLHFHYAAALEDAGRHDLAICHLQTALQLKPHFPEASVQLGGQLQTQGRYEDALPVCRQAVQQAPNEPAAHYHLGTVLFHLGQPSEALTSLTEACRLDPDYAKAHWNSGMALFHLKRFDEAWEKYEWRRRAGAVALTDCSAPCWQGQPLEGKSLAILGEQGIGDEIMFASCYGELLERARACTIVCDPRMARLLARSFPQATVTPHDRGTPQPWAPPSAIDYAIHAGSIPRYTRPDWESFSRRQRYLVPDPKRVAFWQKRYASLGTGLKVGISWRAGTVGKEQRRRLTDLRDWEPLLACEGVSFINLQYGDCRQELERLRETGRLVHDWDDADPLGDIDELAAQVAALDLVISVGNTNVHLAGALGVPAWAVLPRVPGWRWLLDTDRLPWYASVELFRQDEDQQWGPVFRRVRKRLLERLQQGPSLAAPTPKASGSPRLVLGDSNGPATSAVAPSATPARKPSRLSDDALLRKAIAAHKSNEFEEADELYQQFLERQPRHAEALHRWSVVAYQRERFDEAVERVHRAIQLAPRNALYRFHLSSYMVRKEEIDLAIEQLQRALQLDPKLADAQLNLGGLLERKARYDEALVACQKAVDLQPDNSQALYNLANVHFHLGRAEDAIRYYRRACEIDPQYAKSHWNWGMSLLQLGRFSEGWEKYEWREKAGEVVLDHCPKPLWNGSSLANKSILVLAEQGIGDEIMFASCYPDLLEAAGHCTFVCSPRLASLFARSFPQATVQGFLRTKGNRWEPKVPIDVHIHAGSLPRYFRPTWQSFPQRSHYLVPDPELVAQWHRRFAELGPNLKVGISWRAGGVAKEQLRRATDLAHWRDLFALPGVDFINLQYGECDKELELARREWGITIHDWPDADPMGAMDTIAAQVAALDLVISVGNTTVHMAGSVGTPAWAILPRVPGWRWMLHTDRIPWYPAVELFRQQEDNQWGEVFERLTARLQRFVAEHGPYRSQPPEPRKPVIDRPPTVRSEAPVSADVEREPSEADRLVLQGRQRAATGDLDEALDLFRQAIEREPQHADAYNEAGSTLRKLKRLDEAAQMFRRACELDKGKAAYAINLAGTSMQLGQWADAIEPYRRALQQCPDDANARICLGAALQQTGQLEAAAEQYRAALDREPNHPQALNNLGCALQGLDRNEEAVACFQRALGIDPQLVEALQGLGGSLHKLGRLEEALDVTRRAAELRPQQLHLQLNLGSTLYDLERYGEAVDQFRRVLERDPRNVTARLGIGTALHELGDLAGALAAYDEAARLDDGSVEVHYNRANVLRDLHRLDEAVEAYRRAIALRPHYDKAHSNLARVLRQKGRLDEAIVHGLAALESSSDRAAAHLNLASTYLENRQLDEARRALQEALAIDPDRASARVSVGLLDLLEGNFAAGWAAYEARWQGMPPDEQPYRMLDVPVWKGTPLHDQTILVRAEQGVGDEIMFASCLPEMMKRAKKVVVECDRRLVPLLARSFPEAIVREAQRGDALKSLAKENGVDVQILAGSVPRYLRTDESRFPCQASYLVADAAGVEVWRERLGQCGEGLKVGISWSGGSDPNESHQRVAPLEFWHSLLRTPGVQFVNLQYGAARRQADDVARQLGIAIYDWDDVDPLRDLDFQAAQIAALDLVISVSNATVHLAGALGVPTWNLLPLVPGWRWLLDRDDSLWYPSVALLRATRPVDWSAPLAEAERRLSQVASGEISMTSSGRPAVKYRLDQPSPGPKHPPAARATNLGLAPKGKQ